jgi:hypothetical protein
MKNSKLLCSLIGLVIFLIVFACTKNETVLPSDLNTNNENIDPKQNEATWISSDGAPKRYGSYVGSLSIKIYVGHTAAQCGGRCVKILGEPMHLDCRGFGNICNHVAEVQLYEDPLNGELMLILTDDEMFGDLEIFPFPDRSFYITNPQNNLEFWLNVPEQILMKDSSEMEIIIRNAWFSEGQELEND